MNLYEDERDSELKLRIGTGDSFSYEELIQFQHDGLLEDFDSFKISSKFDRELYVYYYKRQYYLITHSRNIKPIDSTLLNGRQMTVVSGSIVNNVQGYVQRYGTEALAKLSKDEVIDLITDFSFEKTEQVELEDIARELDER